MSRIIAGLASSHAYTFVEPDQWENRRAITRSNYARRYGFEPPENPGVATESLADDQVRYGRVRSGLLQLRAEFQRLKPDAWIVIGDDQDEIYREDNLPQFAIYTGENFLATGRGSDKGSRYQCDAALAGALLEDCVEAGIDLASSKTFPNGALGSHAHRDVIQFLDPEGRVPVVPFFVNAIFVPGPTPRRCYEVGQSLRRVIEAQADGKRIALYASGGWSHFTAGYPYAHYHGPHTLGSIAVDFDRQVEECVCGGRGSSLASLTSRQLLDNGDPELRSWIVLLGAIGDARPEQLVYEPFYRAVMGMAVAYWPLEG